MPSTRIEPVIAPVMIIGNPIHTITFENRLRRAFCGTGVCSYSAPSMWSALSSRASTVPWVWWVMRFLRLYFAFPGVFARDG
jgi:hypothetical protein